VLSGTASPEGIVSSLASALAGSPRSSEPAGKAALSLDTSPCDNTPEQLQTADSLKSQPSAGGQRTSEIPGESAHGDGSLPGQGPDPANGSSAPESQGRTSWQDLADTNPDAALAMALSEPADSEAPLRSRLCAGIDFGTSACRFAVLSDGVLDPRITNNVIDNSVTFQDDKPHVGEGAPDGCVVSGAKRLIGREFNDECDYASVLGCEVAKGESGRPVFAVGDKEVPPEEVASLVLQKVKSSLSEQLGEEVVDAVITVPAYFTNSQRQATVDAATIAGFNVIGLQSEPVAALSSRPSDPDDDHLVVVDFGAGKLDLALVRNEGPSLTVVRTAGDTQFGGMDLDSAVADVIANDIPEAERRELLVQSRIARETLSSADETTITVAGQERVLTRPELNQILAPQYEKVTAGLDGLFDGNETSKTAVTEVHVVGGMGNVPEVLQVLQDYFGDSVKVTVADGDAVVRGAAMKAAMLTSNSDSIQPAIKLTTHLSLGLSLADGTCLVLIPRGSAIPATKCTITTTSRDNQRNVGFDVVEGERSMAKDNAKLGVVCVSGIERAPRGVPQIRVSMQINEDGILTVTATDLKTGALITSTIKSQNNLSKDEISKMIAEAEAHKIEDDKAHKLAQWKTRLTGYVDSLSHLPVDESTRGAFSADIENWKRWNSEHANEKDLEIIIRQFFNVRQVVKNLPTQNLKC
jgi:molecular chaperone DnaK (HSP70)